MTTFAESAKFCSLLPQRDRGVDAGGTGGGNGGRDEGDEAQDGRGSREARRIGRADPVEKRAQAVGDGDGPRGPSGPTLTSRAALSPICWASSARP